MLSIGIHHIIVRGIERKAVFKDSRDHLNLLKIQKTEIKEVPQNIADNIYNTFHN